MSLKTEFEEITKNSWGIGILISWGIFLVFAFWNMIWAFILTGISIGYLGQGLVSLIAIGAAALYLLNVLIAGKVSLSKNQLYMLFSIIPLALLFIMAVVTGYLPLVVLLWPYATMFLGSVGIIICTYYYIETQGTQPVIETSETEI